MAAATASSVKILVCGDLYGSLDKAFKRAAKINKAHGPFEALLCVGTTLSNPETGASDLQNYIDGKKKAPLPTYFIAGNEHKRQLPGKIWNKGGVGLIDRVSLRHSLGDVLSQSHTSFGS
eukprot:jgi/Bigna1/82824/fgenesh1_pg.98_\